MLSRRRLQIGSIAAGVLLVASAVAVVKPRDYRAETVLRVTGARSLAAEQLARRVDAVAREVTAPATLQEVARRLAADGLAVGGIPERTQVDAAPAGSGVWDVTIAHTASDPDIAARVVETLAADYQTSAVQRPVQLKESEVAGLDARATEANDALAARKDELDRYVQEHHSYLEGPEERLSGVRDQIREVERVEVASYEGEIERLAQLLEEEPEFLEEKKEVRDADRIALIRREIKAVESELTVLLVEQKRTEEHPAVVAKREILQEMQAELTRVLQDVRTETVQVPNEMHTSLVKARVEAEADLARARRKLAVMRTKEEELLEEVRRAPDLRSERDRLRGAVAEAEETLATRLQALETAQAELQALREENPLQFETIVPPDPPRDPSGPGTLVIAGVGLLLGAFLGIGAACVADARDRSFRDPWQVSAVLGLPTLGAIDAIRTASEERSLEAARRRRANTFAALGLAALAVLAFALVGDATPLQDFVRSVLP